jgi:hypothetical protein
MTKEWFEVPDEDLNFYEEMLVALLGTLSPGGYNLKEGGGSGGRMCEESREKMSIATSGDKNPFYGKSHTDEAREKISNAKKGKTLSDDHKQKMSDSRKGANNYNYGKTLSDFQKQQISKAKKGKPGRKLSEEEKKLHSERMSGDGNPAKRPEVSKKISEAKKGKPLSINEKPKSDEHRKNLSESLKRYHANRKAQNENHIPMV